MHMVVTGANGYVGSRICRALLENGHKVTGIVRSPSREPKTEFRDNNNFELINCELTKINELKKNFKKIEKVNCIFHAAGQIFQRESPGIEIYVKDNFFATLNLLECSRIFDVKKFIFSSTYAVYGVLPGQYDPKYQPVDEDHIAKPFDFYDISKHQSEQLCKFYQERFNISCGILRYSKIFGPGLEQGVVFKIIDEALSNSPIEINGDISTDFVFIDDVINANLLMFDKISSFDVYNIGGGTESLMGLCSKIIQISGSSSKVTYSNTPSSKLFLDISLARERLQYNPTKIEDALLKTIEYVKKGQKLSQEVRL